MEGQKQQRDGAMKPGQDIVAIGCAALYGTAQLAKLREADLLSRFSRTFVTRMQTCMEKNMAPLERPDLEALLGSACQTVTDWQPAGEGGILAALWKLAADHRAGFHIWIREIPVVQESIELCEFFELNPYRLHSLGCQLAVADNGLDVVRAAREKGLLAAVIGKAEPGIKRLLDTGEGVSFLERPRADELESCLKEFSAAQ